MNDHIILIDDDEYDNFDLNYEYEKRKNYDLWTFVEAFALLLKPEYFNDIPSQIFEREFLLNFEDDFFWGLDLTVFKKAVKAEKLKTFGAYSDDNSIFLKLEVSPFDFLEFVKKRTEYQIPAELEFYRDDSGQLKWAERGDSAQDISASDVNSNSESAKAEIIKFCEAEKDRTGQLPEKNEVVDHLEKYLEDKGLKLGPRATLSDDAFRKLWADVPEYHRKVGEKTKK